MGVVESIMLLQLLYFSSHPPKKFFLILYLGLVHFDHSAFWGEFN